MEEGREQRVGLIFTLIYLGFSFLSVADMVPLLAPYRPLLILSGLCTLSSVIPFLVASRTIMREHFYLALGLYGMALASWILHGWVGGVWMTLQAFTPTAIVFVYVVANMRSMARLRILRALLVCVGLFTLTNAVREYPIAEATGEETPYVMMRSSEDGPAMEPRIRGLGILQDPNVYGQFLLMLVALMWAGPKEGMTQGRLLFALPVSLFFIYGAYLTHSRGALLGLMALLLLSFRKKLKIFGTLLVGAILFAAMVAVRFSAGRSVSMEAGRDRLDIWSDGLGVFRSSPIWGVGWRGFTEEVYATAHNSILLCATELGLIGLFFWMALVLVSLLQMRAITLLPVNTREEYEQRSWANALMLAIVVYMVTGFFLSQAYEAQFFMLMGMVAIVASMVQDRLQIQLLPPRQKWLTWSAAASVGAMLLIYIMVRLRV